MNGVQIIHRAAERTDVWSGKMARYPLRQGDVVRLITGTGGGYGPPLERDPELVRRDVLDGFLTAEQARRDYGVVLKGPSKSVDTAETTRLKKGTQKWSN